jgi:HYR domain
MLGYAESSSSSTAGSLALRATLSATSTGTACPAEASDTTQCFTRAGPGGTAQGLGSVTEDYVWSFRMGPPTCPSANLGKPLATTGRLLVAGKGELHFALADGAECVDIEPVHNMPQDFTITGGTGPYQGASGSGRVVRALSGGVGAETWSGTVVAPGVEFDLTPPTLTGATPKTVRAPKGAKRVRVTYKVTAHDAVDGDVPVSCTPRSGSRFKIGRTLVTCSASDTSANTGRTRFRVTVRRSR